MIFILRIQPKRGADYITQNASERGVFAEHGGRRAAEPQMAERARDCRHVVRIADAGAPPAHLTPVQEYRGEALTRTAVRALSALRRSEGALGGQRRAYKERVGGYSGGAPAYTLFNTYLLKQTASLR